MVILLVVVAVLAVGLAAAVLVGRLPAPGVLPAVGTESFTPPPRGGVDPEDLVALRFDQVLRGYRMSQVDLVLERLADELRTRDAEIARLRGERWGVDGDV